MRLHRLILPACLLTVACGGTAPTPTSPTGVAFTDGTSVGEAPYDDRNTSMSTTRANVLEFMRQHSLAVQSSVSVSSSPQAAVVGFIVTDDFEMFFDTLDSSRKASNLRQNPRIAIVVGGLTAGEERTVQYE